MRADFVIDAFRALSGRSNETATMSLARSPLIPGLIVLIGILSLASLVIGASVVVNLAAAFTMPATRRLSENEAAALFTFDIVQLGLLLGLTGGLNNPFALLILAPVTIAATVLGPISSGRRPATAGPSDRASTAAALHPSATARAVVAVRR